MRSNNRHCAAVVPVFNMQQLIDLLLPEAWHDHCEIIPNYMPPYPRKDTVPTVQIRFNNGTKYPPFLRYSKGPVQGYFWDTYGDDMSSVECAIIALSRAPYPIDVSPLIFTLKLPNKDD